MGQFYSCKINIIIYIYSYILLYNDLGLEFDNNERDAMSERSCRARVMFAYLWWKIVFRFNINEPFVLFILDQFVVFVQVLGIKQSKCGTCARSNVLIHCRQCILAPSMTFCCTTINCLLLHKVFFSLLKNCFEENKNEIWNKNPPPPNKKQKQK